VNDYLHLLWAHVEKPYRFDQLQTFIHESCAVNGDFRAHAPVRVLQSLLNGHSPEFLRVFPIERPAGSGEQYFLRTVFTDSHQALEYRRMFAVDRQQLHAVLLYAVGDELSAGYQRFLVGKSDVVACFRRLQRG